MEEKQTNAPYAPAKDPLRPGRKTSEGVITLIVGAIIALSDLLAIFNVAPISPEQRAAIVRDSPIILAALAGLYTIGRSLIKSSAVKQPAQSDEK